MYCYNSLAARSVLAREYKKRSLSRYLLKAKPSEAVLELEEEGLWRVGKAVGSSVQPYNFRLKTAQALQFPGNCNVYRSPQRKTP